MIAPNKFAIKSLGGQLNVTTEEVSLAKDILTSMYSAVKGDTPLVKGFKCKFAGSGGSISGNVTLLPQFSINASADGWSSITLQPVISGALTAASASASTSVKPAHGVPFISNDNKGALTVDKNNLCKSITCDGINIAELNFNVSCQYKTIYRGDPPWPTDYVLDTIKVIADIGFYDFSGLSTIWDTKAKVSISINSIGGSATVLDIGLNCIKVLSGMKTSNSGVNTWHIRVEGNGF